MGWEIGQIEISGTMNEISEILSMEGLLCHRGSSANRREEGVFLGGNVVLLTLLEPPTGEGMLRKIDDRFTAVSDVFDHYLCAF
jgi:hypothetical protein